MKIIFTALILTLTLSLSTFSSEPSVKQTLKKQESENNKKKHRIKDR